MYIVCLRVTRTLMIKEIEWCGCIFSIPYIISGRCIIGGCYNALSGTFFFIKNRKQIGQSLYIHCICRLQSKFNI